MSARIEKITTPMHPDGRIRSADYTLVPDGWPRDWRSWLYSRPDVLEGRYSYRRLPDGNIVDREGHAPRRSVTREKRTITDYLRRQTTYLPEYARLITTILNIPRPTDSVKPIHTDSYRPGLSGIANIGRLHINPMHENCRVSVIVPARMEEKGIYTMLSSYAKQTDKKGNPVDPTTWELNVLVNFKEGEQPDKTYEEIARFRQAYPSIRINVIEVQFRKEAANVGNCRKLITDIVLARALDRDKQGKYTKPLYIETEDADHVRVDPLTIHNVVHYLDKEPHLDSVAGVQDRDPLTIMQNDLLFMDRRVGDFMVAVGRHLGKTLPPDKRDFTWARTVTGGWNVAHCAEALALVDGWNPLFETMEDLDIGAKTSLLRGGFNGSTYVPFIESIRTTPTRTNSSPRRFGAVLKDSIAQQITINAYSDNRFTDPVLEKKIKSLSPEELMREISSHARINYGNKQLFETVLTDQYEKYFKWICKYNTPLAKQWMARVMHWLGFKDGDFVLRDKSVEILFIESFARHTNEYRRLHAKYKGARLPVQQTQIEAVTGPLDHVTVGPDQGFSRKTYFATAKSGIRYVVQTGKNSIRLNSFSKRGIPAHLKEHGVPVPEVLKVTPEFVISERSAGSTLDSFTERAASLKTLYRDAGRTLRHIHFAPVGRPATNGFGSLDSGKRYERWEDFMVAQYSNDGEILTSLAAKQKIDSTVVARVTNALKEAYSVRKPEPLLVHGEFSDEHIMTDGKRLTGIIDWESAMWGDRLYDIAWARFWGIDRYYLRQFEEGYFYGAPITKQQEKCVQAMMLAIGLKHIARMEKLGYLPEWVDELSWKIRHLTQKYSI